MTVAVSETVYVFTCLINLFTCFLISRHSKGRSPNLPLRIKKSIVVVAVVAITRGALAATSSAWLWRRSAANAEVDWHWLCTCWSWTRKTHSVSRFGLVVRRRLVSRRTSVRFRFGSPFSSKRWVRVGIILRLCTGLFMTDSGQSGYYSAFLYRGYCDWYGSEGVLFCVSVLGFSWLTAVRVCIILRLCTGVIMTDTGQSRYYSASQGWSWAVPDWSWLTPISQLVRSTARCAPPARGQSRWFGRPAAPVPSPVSRFTDAYLAWPGGRVDFIPWLTQWQLEWNLVGWSVALRSGSVV